MSEAAADETRAPPRERWQSLDYENVVRAPDTYGVCVIANSREEPILVADGVIRELLWRLLNDAAARAKGASCFAVHVTLLESDAKNLAGELRRKYPTASSLTQDNKSTAE